MSLASPYKNKKVDHNHEEFNQQYQEDKGRNQNTRRSQPRTPQPDHQHSVSTRLNAKDLDSSCYRLSRVPQKFATDKLTKQEQNGNYAETYYKNNPDVEIDTTPPLEKYENVRKALKEKIQSNEQNFEECGEEQSKQKGKGNKDQSDASTKDDERFVLLVQQKSLAFLVFGENSPESVCALTDLGAFYNEHGYPDSALRNLKKAQSMCNAHNNQRVQISEGDKIRLDIETADANMNITPSSIHEKKKKIDLSERLIAQYANKEIEDVQLRFRRDYLLANIYYRKRKYEECVPFFEAAGEAYLSTHNNKPSRDYAGIYACAGEAVSFLESQNRANFSLGDVNQTNESPKSVDLYMKAVKIFEELEMFDDANRIRSRCESRREGKMNVNNQTSREDNLHSEENLSGENVGGESSGIGTFRDDKVEKANEE